MSSTLDRHVHPVLSCAETIGTALKDTVDVQVTFMDPSDKRAALVELTRLEAQLSALKLRVMAVADDVALAEGARDIGALLTHETRTDFAGNRRDLALAQALDRRWAQVADALARSDLNVAQAAVIARALEELPTEMVSPDLLARAEAHLVREAAHFGPRELRVLGRRVLEILAPEIFEQHEAEQLAAEEHRAERRTSLVSTRLGAGTTRITINLPDASATRLRAYLEAFTSPRHAGAGEGDRIAVDRKRGQAFCSLMEAIDPKRLPAHGGDATTLIVTVFLDELRKGLGTADLGPADKLTAGEAAASPAPRRSSRPSSAGSPRSSTWAAPHDFFRPAQRKAMIIRDANAAPRAAPFRQPGARPTTGADPGPRVAALTSRTAYSSATGTTTGHTISPTTAAECPTVTCGLLGEHRSACGLPTT